MTHLAFRNLFQNKVRLVVSVGGVALALLLILSLDAILAGSERQVTAYIDYSGADIFVSQSGVRNMHMAASSLPRSTTTVVQGVRGVASVTPILYVTNVVVAGGDRSLAYVIGLPPRPNAGRPWSLAAGKSVPAVGEAVIDHEVAAKSGVGLGDTVEIMGRDFTVAGLSEGTLSLLNSVAFISRQDFVELRRESRTVSYLLVKVAPGQSPEAVAARIEAQVHDVTAETRAAFSQQERKIVRDMTTDVIKIMNLVGFFIGLAVMALTVYTATFSRRSEYGVLKALGARNGHLYRAVLAQALISVALGFSLGVAFTLLLATAVPRLGLSMALEISGASLVKVGSVSLIIAGAAAILPIRQIAGVDPALVFRK